jgi:UDP-N-acetylmuramoyl-tripeptide--D-alanyl-D-alanine ligase
MGITSEIILFLIWVPQAFVQLFLIAYWWQVKEYRWDRFRLLLQSNDGRKHLRVLFPVWKIIFLALSLFFAPLFLGYTLLLSLLDIYGVFLLLKRKLRKPVFTQRGRRIVGTTVLGGLLFGLSYFLTNNLILTFILLESMLLIGPYIGILWTIPIVNKTKRVEISKAQDLLRRIRPLVIGITGSYGKTTTKEFVSQLLSSKYKTAKTAGSENTELGIARKTLSSVSKGVTHFVVEMGAYKKGEITALTSIVHPNVAIITGIEGQHLSLFGSLEEIKKTKFELIESLPAGSLALFNYSNSDCRKLSEWAKKLNRDLKVYGYILRTSENKNVGADLEITLREATAYNLKFDARMGNKKRKLTAPLKGIHFLENLGAAILLSRLLHIDWNKIEKACANIETQKGTMTVYPIQRAVVIDDSYNSTPHGFTAALEYVHLFSQKKIVVTSGIIELGATSNEVHERIGKELKEIDHVILTQSDFEESLKKGLGKRKTILSVISDSSTIIERLSKYIDEGYAILLEGRLPSDVIEFVKSQKTL